MKPPPAPDTIFVKLFPTDLVIPAASCAAMWQVEVNFVTRTLKKLPGAGGFRVPQWYFVQWSTDAAALESQDKKHQACEAPRCVILMEAMTDPAKPFDILTGMPVEHAIRAAKDLASLHAPYWGWTHGRYRAEKGQHGALKFEGYGHIEDAGKKQAIQGLFMMGAKMGLEIFGSDGHLLKDESFEEERLKFKGYFELWQYWSAEVWPLLERRWKAVLAHWESIPATLIHGDCHVENMFCLKDGTNCYIDFQAVNLGPGVRDLAWLLTSSLTSEDRRAHEKTVIKAYHQALVERGAVQNDESSRPEKPVDMEQQQVVNVQSGSTTTNAAAKERSSLISCCTGATKTSSKVDAAAATRATTSAVPAEGKYSPESSSAPPSDTKVYSYEQCWDDYVFMKIHGLWAGALGGGLFAGTNYHAKTGIFAPEQADDAILERERNSVLFSRIVDDLRHSEWPAMLGRLPEDTL
ncbi:unnamed protein product [Amoebophrya sp. A25]|nr:unnamed protein product [Amoebophrya sp. A25]|eukprot:GSA25T00015700001.1